MPLRQLADLAAVAESCAAKLIRRHPRVYGDRELETAGQVPPCSTRPRFCAGSIRRAPPGADKPGGPQADPAERAEAEQLVGTLLLEAVAVSRRLGVDPELALRQAATRLMSA